MRRGTFTNTREMSTKSACGRKNATSGCAHATTLDRVNDDARAFARIALGAHTGRGAAVKVSIEPPPRDRYEARARQAGPC